MTTSHRTRLGAPPTNQYGSPPRFRSLWKRGSDLSGSNSQRIPVTLEPLLPPLAKSFSSDLIASSFSPRPTYAMAPHQSSQSGLFFSLLSSFSASARLP